MRRVAVTDVLLLAIPANMISIQASSSIVVRTYVRTYVDNAIIFNRPKRESELIFSASKPRDDHQGAHAITTTTTITAGIDLSWLLLLLKGQLENWFNPPA